jgi:hypothetical protein
MKFNVKSSGMLALLLSSAFAATAVGQVVVPATFALPESAADTTKPGFIWNYFQNSGDQNNNNQKTDDALAGLLKDSTGAFLVNNGDPTMQGLIAATGAPLSPPGVKGPSTNSPITFVIATVINMDKGTGSNGNFTPDDTMPGVPGIKADGTSDGTNGQAAEALTYLDLAAGNYTITVNSDDGFRLSMGGAAPSDKINAVMIGECSCGRGASDTTMNFTITKAGLYATRLTWENGGGGANIEFFTTKADGTKVLVNDTANGGVKAYRGVTGGANAYAQKTVPNPGGGVAYDTPIAIELVDGGTPIVTSSVKLSVDGTNVTSTVTKSGNITSIAYTFPAILAPKSKHTVGVAFTDSKAETLSYNFQVADYALLTKDLAVTPDTSKPGFIWNYTQNDQSQPNSVASAESRLAGLIGTNLVDVTVVGAALAAGIPNPTNLFLPAHFEIATTINLDKAAGSNGNITPDDQMPGTPGIDGSSNGQAAEILYYVDLQPGTYQFSVNSDDGFQTTAGLIGDVFKSHVAGQFDGGRGASDTIYRVIVKDAGVYAFRTVWENGGGGSNIELTQKLADGTWVLLNGTGGPKTYRAITSALPTRITQAVPADGSTAGPADKIDVVINEGSDTVTDSSVKLTLNGAPITATVKRTGKVLEASYQPSAPLASGSTNTVTIAYTSTAGSRTESWTYFTGAYNALTKDKVSGYLGGLLGSATFTADKGGQSGKAGDYGLDLTTNGGPVQVIDSSFLTAVNAASHADQLSVSLWVKKYDIANGSAFWFSAPSETRIFQAHIPWSDDNIYFDTQGCCGGGTQRINANISTFADWKDDTFWTNVWHHFVFTKNSNDKNIYIDGQLFLNGQNTSELSADINQLAIGSDNSITGGQFHAVIDDFAVYGAALPLADALALSKGTLPNALPAADKLIAYWNFDDAPKGGATSPTVSIAVDSTGKAVLTYTGTLQSAATISGPFSNVAGATSPYTIAPGSTLFYRAQQ